MAQKKKEGSTGFLHAHGYGPARLASTLARIHWTRADGLARGRQALDLYLATCAEILLAAAKERRRTPGTLLGELVANNDPAERPLLWLLAQYLTEVRGMALRLPAARRTALSRAATPLRNHARLLLHGTLAATHLPELVPDRPRSALVLMHRQLRARLAPDDARIAAQLVRLALRLGGDRPLPLLRSACQLLGTDGHASRLTHATFRRLPPAARRHILFTPGLAGRLLDDTAQSAVRPPSPGFDPLFTEQALLHLADGVLDHVDIDALVLATPALRTRIVDALADGSGRLDCADDVRARLLSAAGNAELCLVACAAARNHADIRTALAQLPAIPARGVLGEALHRFAVIAFADWLPADVPATLLQDAGFVAGMQDNAARRLAAHVRGIDSHDAPGTLLRQFTAWLACAPQGPRRRQFTELHAACSRPRRRFLAGLSGSDLHALAAAGSDGERLAITLIGAARTHQPLLWRRVLFPALAAADPGHAAACAWGDFRGHEIETLLHTPEAARVLHYFRQRPERRHTRGWHDFIRYLGDYATLPAVLADNLAANATADDTLALEIANRVPTAAAVLYPRLDLDMLVDHAMRDPRLARRIEQHIGRAMLAAHGRAQADGKSTRPGLAAARELALAIGLQHGSYLAFLARRLRPPHDGAGNRYDDLYRTWALPKRNGGTRTITAPVAPLKAVQRAILDQLLATLPVHPAATGFVPGRSIVDNAAPHARQPLVVNMDIRDFFPGTSPVLIRRACLQLRAQGLSTRACLFIADICCHNGGLPIGAPTSPALANQVLRGTDRALATAAARRDVRYTRYADDITFSGAQAATLLPFARRLLGTLGYVIDERKTNLFRRGRRQVVTGLVVNERPTMARALRRRLRAAVDCRVHGGQPRWDGLPLSDAQLGGLLAFLAQTQPAEARALRLRLQLAPPLPAPEYA